MKLKTLKDIEVSKKRVLVRADLDVGESFAGEERLNFLLPTLDYLAKKGSIITLMGHRGRPEGKKVKSLSMKPVADALEDLLKKKWGKDRVGGINMHMMENLRFNKGEEANDKHHAEHLATSGEIYVNEAFATSHRKHASIVSVPKFLPGVCGFRFCKEVDNLDKVRNNPNRPVVVLVSGVKEDKLKYLDDFKSFADMVLIGGRLPIYLVKSVKDEKIFISELTDDKLDIRASSIKVYEEVISKAGTVVVSGPVSKFDKDKETPGTKRIFTAVSQSKAFKLAGGGDTRFAIKALGLQDKFDWISVGGGAMLEFLASGTLPGIKALLHFT